jgi:hypothetical protein
MRRLKVESTTDSEFDQSCSESFQPYNVNEITVTVSAQPRICEDGAVERVAPTVETSSAVVPGRELCENRQAYSQKLEEYKRDHRDFAKFADPATVIPLSVQDEIVRMPNAPEIVEFLSFAPDVCAELCNLHPLEAARKVQEMSDDLSWGHVPEDRVSYEVWKNERNRQEASRPHKPRKR